MPWNKFTSSKTQIALQQIVRAFRVILKQNYCIRPARNHKRSIIHQLYVVAALLKSGETVWFVTDLGRWHPVQQVKKCRDSEMRRYLDDKLPTYKLSQADRSLLVRSVKYPRARHERKPYRFELFDLPQESHHGSGRLVADLGLLRFGQYGKLTSDANVAPLRVFLWRGQRSRFILFATDGQKWCPLNYWRCRPCGLWERSTAFQKTEFDMMGEMVAWTRQCLMSGRRAKSIFLSHHFSSSGRIRLGPRNPNPSQLRMEPRLQKFQSPPSIRRVRAMMRQTVASLPNIPLQSRQQRLVPFIRGKRRVLSSVKYLGLKTLREKMLSDNYDEPDAPVYGLFIISPARGVAPQLNRDSLRGKLILADAERWSHVRYKCVGAAEIMRLYKSPFILPLTTADQEYLFRELRRYLRLTE